MIVWNLIEFGDGRRAGSGRRSCDGTAQKMKVMLKTEAVAAWACMCTRLVTGDGVHNIIMCITCERVGGPVIHHVTVS